MPVCKFYQKQDMRCQQGHYVYCIHTSPEFTPSTLGFIARLRMSKVIWVCLLSSLCVLNSYGISGQSSLLHFRTKFTTVGLHSDLWHYMELAKQDPCTELCMIWYWLSLKQYHALIFLDLYVGSMHVFPWPKFNMIVSVLYITPIIYCT